MFHTSCLHSCCTCGTLSSVACSTPQNWMQLIAGSWPHLVVEMVPDRRQLAPTCRCWGPWRRTGPAIRCRSGAPGWRARPAGCLLPRVPAQPCAHRMSCNLAVALLAAVHHGGANADCVVTDSSTEHGNAAVHRGSSNETAVCHTGMAVSACCARAAATKGGCNRKRGWLRGLSGLHSTNRAKRWKHHPRCQLQGG